MMERIEVLFEDALLIVCVKPAGVLSQEAVGKPNMVALLREQTGGEIYPVHRLDKPVGGVMVFAKTKETAAALSAQIASGQFHKRYLARVHGLIEPPAGEWEDFLFKDAAKNKVYVVKRQRKGVKRAKLCYRVLKQSGDTSLAEVELFTGRTHQIRVQFASRGYPLLGDGRYGARDGEKQLRLWSYQLEFAHPVSGEALSFKAKSKDMEQGGDLHA